MAACWTPVPPILWVSQVVCTLIIELCSGKRHLYQLKGLVLDTSRRNVRHRLWARSRFETTWSHLICHFHGRGLGLSGFLFGCASALNLVNIFRDLRRVLWVGQWAYFRPRSCCICSLCRPLRSLRILGAEALLKRPSIVEVGVACDRPLIRVLCSWWALELFWRAVVRLSQGPRPASHRLLPLLRASWPLTRALISTAILSEVEVLVWASRACIVNELIHLVCLRRLKQALDMVRPIDFLLEQLGVLSIVKLGLLSTECIDIKLVRVLVSMFNVPVQILQQGLFHTPFCLVNRWIWLTEDLVIID